MESEAVPAVVSMKESFSPEHGIHRFRLTSGQVVTAVSAKDWHQYSQLLADELEEQDQIVVSPELITCSDFPLDEIIGNRSLVEERLSQVQELSGHHPGMTFLVGTPTYSDGDKPRNSLVFIKNGSVVGQTNKRFGTVEGERGIFEFTGDDEPVALIPGTHIAALICSDLAAMGFYSGTTLSFRIAEVVRKRGLTGTNPNFIDEKTTSLVISACWGVGGNRVLIQETGDPDTYYRNQLRVTCRRVLAGNPTLKDIVLVDRKPVVGAALSPFTPTEPINAHIKRD